MHDYGNSGAQTVYLDTANWYDLIERTVARGNFEKAIQSGHIVPVLSYIHIIEFGKRAAADRRRVTEYLDSLQALGEIRWIKGLPQVTKEEVENALLASIGMPSSRPNPFAKDFVDSLSVKLPWYDAAEARTFTIGRIVEEFSSLPKRDDYERLRREHAVFDIEKLRILKKDSPQNTLVDAAECATFYLHKHVVTPHNIQITITPDILTNFKKTFDLSLCPALQTKLRFFEGWSKSTGGELPSMMEDLFHLVALPYCHVTFVDGGTWEALKKGKSPVMLKPTREFMTWQGTISHMHESSK